VPVGAEHVDVDQHEVALAYFFGSAGFFSGGWKSFGARSYALGVGSPSTGVPLHPS